MARINLLPWREELRKKRQKDFGITVGIAVVAMLAVVGLVHLQIDKMIDYQNMRNQRLAGEITLLDRKIAEIKDLEREKENLLARMRIVEQLQTSRPEVVHLFDELAKTLPEGVYLTSLTQRGKNLNLDGYAQSNARVSSFMRALDGSDWLDRPDLKMIQAEEMKRGATSVRLSKFTLSATQVRPDAQQAEGETAP